MSQRYKIRNTWKMITVDWIQTRRVKRWVSTPTLCAVSRFEWTHDPTSLYEDLDHTSTKISDLIHTKLKHYMWPGRHVRSASEVHKVVANQPFDNSVSNFSAIKEKLCTVVAVDYDTRSRVIHLAFNGKMPAGIFEFLDLMVDQSTAVKTDHCPASL